MKSKIIGLATLAAALVVPSMVFADSSTGLLNVYVQVINQTGSSWTPSHFNVSVSGENPSPSNFRGSNQGTLVTLEPGDYSVTVTNAANFNPSYSVGCDSEIDEGETQTCVVTINVGSYYYPSPTPYPYPYPQTQPLTCRTDTPTVALGQSARFSVVGGVGGTYNWVTPFQNYPNIGPVLTTTFPGSGTYSVTVTNAAQTATCSITVTSTYYPIPQPPVYPTPGTPSYIYPFQPPTFTAQLYPRFPNTGFEPITSAQMAFATVFLMAAAFALYPHARKAFALATR
jgi:hypothetical protein